MFAVFAAVAAVGSSMVLGAGFERLRAGFDLVRRQSGFFADAIHKLDQRTQKLDEETAKLKSGLVDAGDRIGRVEKQTIFLGDAITSIEHRILQGTPVQAVEKPSIRMQDVAMPSLNIPKEDISMPKEWMAKPVREQSNEMPSIQAESLISPMFRDNPEDMPTAQRMDDAQELEGGPRDAEDSKEESMGITTLISRYWTGEQSGSGKQVVYH
jgi:hypothetical protein